MTLFDLLKMMMVMFGAWGIVQAFGPDYGIAFAFGSVFLSYSEDCWKRYKARKG